jgi:hypothetical protein
MLIYVYVSDLTGQTVITKTDHGKEWIVAEGEVYDLMAKTDIDVNVITLDARPASASICTEKDLEDTIVA